MALTGYNATPLTPTGIEATRERSVEEILSEACHAATNALQILENMESAGMPAKEQSPMPAGIVASALYLHANLGELHQRLNRLGERLGRL